MSRNTSLTPLTTPLEDGRTLIEASAGSGKTRAITTLVARLVVEKEREIDSILVVTFTKAATAELRERIRSTLKSVEKAEGKAANADDDQAEELLEQWEQDKELDEATIRDRIKLALLDIDRANIQTIHSFCQRALTEFAFETGFSFEFEVSGDGGGIVESVVRDFWQDRFRGSSRILAKYLKNKKFMPDELAKWYAASRAKSFTEIKSVPESAKEPAELEKALREKLVSFISIWREQGEAFTKIMLGSDAFNRQKYQLKTIEKRLRYIEKVAAKGDLPLDIDLLLDRANFFGAPKAAQCCKKDRTVPENPLFAAFDELAADCKTFLDQLAVGLRLVRKQLIGHAQEEIRRRVRQQRRLGYDDLLIEMRDALDREGSGRRLAHSIRHRFPVALIDEFQDTDPTQERIFSAIYGSGEDFGEPDKAGDGRGALYIVGDPKQSIYQFRGADIFAYLSAQQGAESSVTLGKNYRSTPALVEACNTIFDIDSAFTIPEIGFSPATPGRDGSVRLELEGKPVTPLQFWLLEDFSTIGDVSNVSAHKTANDIVRLLNLAREGKAKIGDKLLAASDIAVLVARKIDGSKVAKELRRRGARSVEIYDSSIFDSREAGQVYRLLLALANRGRQDYRRAALAGDVFGLDSEDLLALIEEDDYWSHWAEKFDEWIKDWIDKGVGAMLRKIIGAEMKHWPEAKSENDSASGKSAMSENAAEEITVGSGNLLNRPAGPRRLTNFYHLIELLQEAETENQYSPAGVLAWLNRRIMGQAELRQTEAVTYTLRLDSDENLVKISTIHRSKGLQYPIVYLPFAWFGRDPKNSPDDPVEYHVREDGRFPSVLDLAPDDAARGRRELEEFGESVRLLYVALTRAEEYCVVAWTRITRKSDNRELPPLAWLLHREEKVSRKDGDAQAKNAVIPDPVAIAHAELKSSIPERDRNTFEEDVSFVAGRCKQGIELHDLDSAKFPVVRLQGAGSESTLDPPREFNRRLHRIRRMTSYTDLAAEHAVPRHRFFEIAAADHDQNAVSVDADEFETESQKHNVFNFPRGAQVGNCLHKIFEIHHKEPERPLEEICQEQLIRAGIDKKWRTTARNMVENTLSADLSEIGRESFRLRNIKRRLCELEFFFPVQGLSCSRMAELLARFGYPELLREVPDEQAINGFLRGFIDLTFEHNGRWYIADYKSNHLGYGADDYRREQLESAMRQHNYPLQYLIYLLALHRYLGTRIADYDYERHIGGVFYLFLRGMTPATGMSRGVWFDRPDKACIDALDNFMKSAES